MKTREEYAASIYAKRDARLAKRKKAIGGTVSALCIVICFCAVAFIMPEMTKKTSDDVATDVTLAVNNAEGTADTEDVQNVENDEKYITTVTVYEKSEVEDYENLITQGQKNFGYNESDFAEQATAVSAQKENAGEGGEMEIALETEIAQEYMDGIPSATTSSTKYTSKEITAAAYVCLTESEKKAVEGIEPFVTVTRTSGGREYYDISYRTDIGKIKITLNAENLELIEKSGSVGSTSGTTAAPPVVMTTPAYNPNS